MKIIFSILLTSIILFSCTNDKIKVVQSYRDTSYPLAMYLGYGKIGIEQDVVRKITIHDTLIWDINKDTMSAKKIVKDSIYYEGFMNIPVRDSATMKALGIKKIDTVIRRLLFVHSSFLREFPNYDGKLKELKALMDTTKMAADSTKK
jgi:hypothetical protein